MNGAKDRGMDTRFIGKDPTNTERTRGAEMTKRSNEGRVVTHVQNPINSCDTTKSLRNETLH